MNKAGSTDIAAVTAALESGLSFDAPNGTVTIEPGSHHLRQNIYIVEGDANHSFNVVETFDDVAPAYENAMCDLIADPTIATQFTPEGN